jgi:pyrimidine-nucleoside phosphorylase
MADAAGTLLAETFRRLRLNTPLSHEDLEALQAPRITKEQQSAVLAALSLRSDLTAPELRLFRDFARSHGDVLRTLGDRAIALLPSGETAADPVPHWAEAIAALRTSRPIGRPNLQHIVDDIVSGAAKDTLVAAWLMTVCAAGMGTDDTRVLTELMASSGERFDYREAPELSGLRLIRRYPTGALSEKVALILPSLIASVRTRAPVCSPFLVARSLGHTGGTWDKLSAIPGFVFPEPGDDSIRALKSCGVAMTVTQGHANPADRKLYQLRSATGTVESNPLIVASIASKQLTFPVHRLLLDVRVGPGAFLKDQSAGTTVGREISALVRREGISCSYTLTPTAQPSGSAIGNALEVAEAIAVMGGSDRGWDPRALAEQRLIAVDFFAKLMAAEVTSMNSAEWARVAFEQLNTGAVLRHFAEVLNAHGVSASTATGLLRDPAMALAIPSESLLVRSTTAGVFRSLDQPGLGEIVNRILGAGGNEFEGSFDPTGGIVLGLRLGDVVRADEPLCRVFSCRRLSPGTVADIAACFLVEPEY